MKSLETVLADEQIKALVGFSLASKVNGRIVSRAMKCAFNESRLPSGDGIDGFNELMAEMQEIEASNEFFEQAGIDSVVVDPKTELAQWLHVRQELVENGIKPQPLSENFRFILEKAGGIQQTDEELARLSALSGQSVETLKATFANKTAKNFGETRERVLSALRIINEVEPATDEPAELADLVLEAFKSGKKSAVQQARNTEEALANLIILKATEDTL